MESYELIADVSRTLVDLLRRNMIPEPVGKEELIGLCAPYDPGNIILGLYVYNIEEKKGMGSQGMINVSPGLQKDPPTPLMINYMLTVYSKTEMGNRAIDEQRILGRAIQVLKDHSKLKGNDLQGVLQTSNTHMEINNLSMTMDDKVKVWSLFNQPYQLSMYYTVGPVYLESDNVRDTRPVLDFQVDMKRTKL